MGYLGGMPFPVQFFLAFVIVLGLIGATAWAVRRFGGGRLGGVGARGRQPRLAVVDYASVDARRRLILVRRDNIEHLVMIGGPTDIVVESNIVRAAAPTRDVGAGRTAAVPEALPRAIPLPDATGNGARAPAEAAASVSAPRAPRVEVAPEEPAAFPLQPNAETAPRTQRETLTALADEISPRPAPARIRPQAGPRPQAVEARQDAKQEAKQEQRVEPRHEPRNPVTQPAAVESASTADQSLAEMAHRLEAALRRPAAKSDKADARGAAPMPRAVAPATQESAAEPDAAAASPPSPPSRVSQAPEVKSPRLDAKQSNPGKTLYDSLEQEMASLLGRPTAKN
jgi:flagellar protein FliO/FliZ